MLREVVAHLDAAGVPVAVIGATALSVHGISRSTADIDLLTIERRVLTDQFWSSFTLASADVRVGDHDDPLAGVVRLRGRDARALDVIVAKYRFAAAIISRAQPAVVSGVTLRVATLADLVLLKVFAGGPQDAWDIEQALTAGGASLLEDVEQRIEELPSDGRAFWTRIRNSR